MLIGLSLGLFTHPISAATKEISEIAPGSVVSVNGVKFVKLNNNNQFVAVAPSICPNFATGMYMQDFTSAMCASAPTPSGTDYFPIGVLTDRRDNKQYEVRKFADGNCWMVDSLAYGGSDLNNGKDGCLKTTYCGYGYNPDGSCVAASVNAVSTVDKIAPGLYGDCRYPYDDITTADADKYGYLYQWQAAVQDANAYYGQDYQPPQPTQGICPDGWYLPTGGPNGQLKALYTATGSNVSFWRPGGNWKGPYSGNIYIFVPSPQLTFQGERFYAFSSTQASDVAVYNLGIYADNTYGGVNHGTIASSGTKIAGFSVRCLKTP